MSHPTLWSPRHFLYAIGNTPAVCFTNGHPPEQPTDILLLGGVAMLGVCCTQYMRIWEPVAARKLDFICCDAEPAVLARNVLLYTLIADLQENDTSVVAKMWNLYYHFFIDSETLDLVVMQSRQLADLSVNLDTWNNSKYAGFLRFCNIHTLSELHRHWVLYGDMQNLPKTDLDTLQKQFCARDPRCQDSVPPISLARAAGPLWFRLERQGAYFKHYWDTGVIFIDREKITASKLMNPTFAYSIVGRGFALHYGSHPFLSFHLARGLAHLKGTGLAPSLHESCFTHFKSWCYSLNKRLKQKSPSITIRFNRSIDTYLYTTQWTSNRIQLDGGDYLGKSPSQAPLQFDVIDTSNPIDHIGFINVLVTAVPLLKRRPSSILHTTPVSYVSNFTTRSTFHEYFPPDGIYERISWKIGSLSDSLTLSAGTSTEYRLNFDAKQLAGFLHGFYSKMFYEEDMVANFANMKLGSPLTTLCKLTLVNYSRFTFAYLLRVIRNRVMTDWYYVIEYFHDLIVRDSSLLLGTNNFQDLFCHLYMLGLHTFYPLSPGINDALAHQNGPFKGWKKIPPVVCVVLVVPRDKFRLFKNGADLPEIGFMSTLVVGTSALSSFYISRCVFGDVRIKYPDRSQPDEPSVTIQEDKDGLRGSSPLVVMFYVPTWLLGQAPHAL
ncbi:hypothetical protein AMATHDRAFT_3985 [Amanita thiersii Skay4041]|uniref:DUF4470 domain-containing protein n=1 Tax=Amanita thiersii Skay4041 TaxID=703135 RepID=A0A2A9NIK5_9AGAR|nr:hypothetical protein AMATHDRAFT_3985 [Amanita thiersii Skay4041]